MKKTINLLLFSLFAISASAQDLTAIPKENFKITNLGPQVTDIVLQGSVFAKDPDGRTLIYTVVRGTPAHLLGFDTETRKLAVDIPLPKTDGSWDLEVSSTGVVYVAGGSGGFFYKHVPGTKQAENLGKVLGTETYIWDLSAGKDGEIYGATYPNCRVFRYHPTEGYTDFGNGPLVEGENYVRGLVYNHTSQKIYAGIGSHAHLIELDAKSKTKVSLLPQEYKSAQFVYDIGQVEGLKSGDRIFFTVAGAKKVLVYNITKKRYEGEMPEFPVKAIIKDPASEKVYYVHNSKLMMLDYKEENPTPVELSNFRGKPLASAWNEKGELLFLNSYQQIITFNPATSQQKTQALIDVPAQPISLTYIDMGPDNKIWSGGYLGGSNAAYDLKKNKATVYKGLSQTESATKLGSKIYFGNYPKARFNVYDISAEWSLKDKNPKQIGSVSGQDRPFGALAVPSLNKVFFGTVPEYGINGGALIEIDATTDNVVSHGEVVQKQSIITLAFHNDMLIGGCSIWGGLGIQPVEKEAKLFVWDPAKKQKIFEVVPVPGAKAITALMNGPDGHIWGYAGGTLFKFDVKKKAVILTKHVYDDKRDSFLWRPDALVLHPNGMIYGDFIGKLISLDPKTLEVKSFNISGANIILGLDKEMYYRSGKEIWRLDILKR